MDQADLKLLRILQVNNRKTADEIAHEVGLSASAVQKRLVKLRKSGAIQNEVAIIAPKSVAGLTFFVVRVQVNRTGQAIRKFSELANREANIVLCMHVTGDCDFLLIIAAKGAEEYGRLCDRIFVEENHVARFETSVVLNNVKYGLQLPI